MTKLHPRLLATLTFLLCTYMGFSQFSVTATAGTTGPTLYTTLKVAVDAINAGTHQGNITVNITGNSNETGAIVLKGSGSGNTNYSSVLIKPSSGVTASISGDIPPGLLVLDSANNVTVDGSNSVNGTTKNLTLINTGISGPALFLKNGASNNIIKNTILQGAALSGGVVMMGTSNASTGNNNNIIENNDITKSSIGFPIYGIWNIGTDGKPNSGNIYRKNRIFDFFEYGFLDGGAYTSGFSNNTLIEGNEFFGVAPTTSTSKIGIRLDQPNSISNMVISKNKIYSLVCAPGGQAIGIDVYDVMSVTVVNNMISLINNPSSTLGIGQGSGPGAEIKVYHNTVYLAGNSTDFSAAYAKYFSSTGDDVRNNIFVNKRISTVEKQYAFVNVLTTNFTSNYNNLVSQGNAMNMLGGVILGTAIDYPTLGSWQAATALEVNSTNVNPVFISASDLHLNTAGNGGISNTGTPLASVTMDFDNDSRSTTTPDVGADEFISGSCATPVITAQPAPQAVCPGNPANFSVSTTGSGLTFQWKKNGIILSGATTNTYSIPSVSGIHTGSYTVEVFSGTCSVTSNAAVLSLTTLPVITTQPTGITTCLGQSATFTVAATGTSLTYQWQYNGTNIPGATNNSFTINNVTANFSGAFRVVIKSGNCSVTSLTVNLTVSGPCTSLPNLDQNITSVKLMPNILNNATVLRVIAERTSQISWIIIDMNGRVVMTFKTQVAAGQNDFKLSLASVDVGTYQILGISPKGRTEVVRLIKL